MTCRRPPFASDNMADLIAAHLSEAPADPLVLVPSTPIELRDCILRCLAKHPTQRFQRASELAECLRDVAICKSRKRAPRPEFADDETRFDPQIAARIAIEWSDDITTAEKAKSQPQFDESNAAHLTTKATTDARDVWERRVAVIAMIIGIVGLAAVITSVSIPAMTEWPTRNAPLNRVVPAQIATAAVTPNQTTQDVELRIDTVPPGAEVVSGPVVLGTTPFMAVTKPSPGTAVLEVRSPGFATRTIQFATDTDEHFTIRLHPNGDHHRLLANREQDGGTR